MDVALADRRDTSALARAFARHGVTRCAIMATTFRSGSTWIGRIMDRHGLAGMKHERLRRLRAGVDPNSCLDAILTDPATPTFATRLMWVQRNRLAHLLGYSSADCAPFAAQFPRASWLFLRRRDVFAQGISYWRARATVRWHVPLERGEQEPAIPYDFAGIDGCVHALVLHDRLWSDFFTRAGVTPQTVWYEDLLSNSAPIDAFMGSFGLALRDTESTMKVLSDAHSAYCRERYIEDLYRVGRGPVP